MKPRRIASHPCSFLAWIIWISLVFGSDASTNFSAWVFPGPSGRLLYRPDALGNRVLDYSSVGYKGGGIPIPDVPVKTNLLPVAGDNVANLQSAINYVSSLPLDGNGFRGAVLLSAGEYPLSSQVTIGASGVVLRGVGSGANGTILRAIASNQHTLISITGSGSASTPGGTTHSITNQYVPVGARSFSVDSTSGLAAGDNAFVRRVATSNWIHDLGMDLLCCPPDSDAWTAEGYNIDSDRVITRIEGNRIFIDAPLSCAIDRAYTNGTIRKYNWAGRIQNCGIERLRGVSNFTNSTDENHGWTFVQFSKIENGWARDIVSQYFGYACVSLESGSKRVSVVDCQSLDPISQVTGGRRYAFVMNDNTLCLVQNCYTRDDRHQFVTQSLTTGPNVFVDGLSDSARADAGPHHRWGTGALWDNVTVNGNNLNVQNRGNLGSGHGWSGANEVVWNCDADGGFVVQNPPTARNWLIGSIGPIENGTVYVGPHDPGTYDSHGSNVFPNSLYYAQMQDRLAAANVQSREYWLGEIARFTNSNPAGETVPVDSAWRTAIQNAAGGASVDGFDVITNGHWVPFTFGFSPAANERVVGASLVISMLSSGSSATNDVLYLDSLANSLTLAGLGWLPISTAATNPTVRVLDLSSQLGLLADGQLNLAVQNDVGVDWAMLELQVAQNVNAGTVTLAPVADATVRGGASANNNFGTNTILTTKADSQPDFERKAYLRWDLSSLTGTVYHAKVRLTPVAVGTNGIEQGVAFAANDGWSETGITWNNQPGAGKRFATWIPGTNASLELMVTPQILEALAGDKQLSLQLYALRNVGAPGFVDYASREHPDPNSRPQLLLTVASHPPTVFFWNGPGAGANDWSTATNWSPPGVPETLDDLKCFDAGALGVGLSNVNNFVDFAFSGNIASLHYANSNGNHTTLIAPGKTLIISGTNGLTVGTETDNGSGQAVFATITGPGGAVVLDNPNASLLVRQGSTANGTQRATLDFSGLGTFSARVDQVLVGVVGPVNRSTGTLLLAKTNTLTGSGSPGILIGDNNSNAGGQHFLYLGQTNAIFADSITIARQKAAATLKFNTGLSNPSAYFRGADGVGRVSLWNIADHSLQSSSSSSDLGTNDFSGGNVNLLADTLTLGKSQKTTGAGSIGVLTFTDGTVDVNTLQAGFQAQSNASSGGVGRVNVNGTQAVLVVNAVLELGHTSGGTGGTNTLGLLNVDGGSLFANTISVGTGSGSNSLTVNNGKLILTNTAGTPANPINSVALTNSKLYLAPHTNSTNINATSLITGGSSNQINIASLPPQSSHPARFSLICYSGTMGGAGNNFSLGALPSPCTGYISNNTSARSVELIITGCTPPKPSLYIAQSGNNLIFNGSNGIPNALYYLLASTNIALPAVAWTRMATNFFDSAGSFQLTNAMTPTIPLRFYLLQIP